MRQPAVGAHSSLHVRPPHPCNQPLPQSGHTAPRVPIRRNAYSAEGASCSRRKRTGCSMPIRGPRAKEPFICAVLSHLVSIGAPRMVQVLNSLSRLPAREVAVEGSDLWHLLSRESRVPGLTSTHCYLRDNRGFWLQRNGPGFFSPPCSIFGR